MKIKIKIYIKNMVDLNTKFKEMYNQLINRTITLTNKHNPEAKTMFEVNYMLLQEFINEIKAQRTSDANDRIIKILSDEKLKKDYYINHVSTYDKDGNMYLDDNSIVYIAIKDRKKNDLLCVFGLKDEPYIQ